MQTIIHTNAILDVNNAYVIHWIQLLNVQRLFRCDYCELPQFEVLHIPQSMSCIVTSFQRECLGWHYCEKNKWPTYCHILKMIVNGATTIFGIASWNIQSAVWLQQVIIELSAAFLGNNSGGHSSTMSYKWASTECQRLCALDRGKCMGCTAMLPYNRAIGRLSRQRLVH
jgi:hypothetical protein